MCVHIIVHNCRTYNTAKIVLIISLILQSFVIVWMMPTEGAELIIVLELNSAV